MRILFCGLSGIPNVPSASINRYMAIAQAMSVDNEIIFINRCPLFKSDKQIKVQPNSFRVNDATGVQWRPESFLKRKFLKLTSYFYEYKALKKINREKKIDILNVYSQYISVNLFYYILSKLFHFKTILHYVELRSSFKNRSFFYRLNSKILDKQIVLLYDNFISISTRITDHIVRLKPTANVLLIPPICDFRAIDAIEPEVSENKYFVFCGAIAYEEVILFIINSFLKLEAQNKTQLHLVINGKVNNETISNLIENNKETILLFSNLDYEKLISKYKGSLAQLIPLRNTIQDSARFPQKICEYLASKRPIVTTNFGEIPHYFTDNLNAIVANDYDIDTYSHKLEWIINNQDKLTSISENSYLTGLDFFDINCYTTKLKNFILC